MQCNPAHQHQDCQRNKQPAAPDPILVHSRMSLSASEAQAQLPQRSKISIKKKPWRLSDSDPNHASAKPDFGQTIQIVHQTAGKKRMQLAEKNELPAFAFHRRFEGVKALRSFETPLQPAPPDGSANQKRNGGTGHIANQHNQESPP